MDLTSRLPDVGTSIFTIMSKMAADHGAINLSQGFPDFPVSEQLIDLIHQHLRAGHNQYAPMAGLPALREQLSRIIGSTYQRATDADTEITITAGGTEALFSAIASVVHPGDEVILFDPSYDSYDPSIRLNGGVPVHMALQAPDFAIDWQAVEQRISPRTRAIIINTPHNPTGAVRSTGDLQELARLANQYNLIVISDEVYERIIFGGKSHESVLKYPALRNRSIAVFSFGKTFHATGWKIGYTVAAPALTSEIRKAHQFITFSVNTPIQHALAEFLTHPENYEQLGTFYERKRAAFLDGIRGSSFRVLPCFGSYFQLLDYSALSDRPDTEMAEWLTREHKVASIPVSVFYLEKPNARLLRFCFAKREETLEKATRILARF